MLGFSSKIKYRMCCTLIDMRKGFDGLSGLVRNYLNQDPGMTSNFGIKSRGVKFANLQVRGKQSRCAHQSL